MEDSLLPFPAVEGSSLPSRVELPFFFFFSDTLSRHHRSLPMSIVPRCLLQKVIHALKYPRVGVPKNLPSASRKSYSSSALLERFENLLH